MAVVEGAGRLQTQALGDGSTGRTSPLTVGLGVGKVAACFRQGLQIFGARSLN